MTSLEEAAYGAAGAALWIIIVHGIPTTLAAARGEITWTPSLQRVLGVAGFLVCYLVLGAAAPFIADAESGKEAAAVGLGWQGVFGQFTKGHLTDGGTD